MTTSRVLIVDDEPKMQRILEIMLVKMGHIPLLASNGWEALNILHADSVDLVISDLKMPVMNGMELLRNLRHEGNDIPYIIMTAYGTVETAVEAMKFGAYDYIMRPFDMNAVELAIKRSLDLRHIRQENAYLREEAEKGWGEFIGRSAIMTNIYEMIQQVARGKTNVLIVGETGTGKELVARAIHHASPRRDALFVPINCAAIPTDLLESELFGYCKGAFTGAVKDKPGKFEMAEGGTLFLDEITEMNPMLQAKLLRVLQDNYFERLGSNDHIPMDIRIIAATNRDPAEAVRQEKLRDDLYYRIQVFSIEVPPLRSRPEDIPLLAEHFVQKQARKLGISAPEGIDQEAVERFKSYRWPGNVRELENVIERAMVLTLGKQIGIRHLPPEIAASERQAAVEPPRTQRYEEPNEPNGQCPEETDFTLEPAVERLERQYILKALEHCGGSKTKAARLLDISERTLWYKIKKYELH